MTIFIAWILLQLPIGIFIGKVLKGVSNEHSS